MKKFPEIAKIYKRVVSLCLPKKEFNFFNMTDILSLPPEILNRILDYLPLRELSSVCLTCKKLRDVVYVDSVWQKKCKQGMYPLFVKCMAD